MPILTFIELRILQKCCSCAVEQVSGKSSSAPLSLAIVCPGSSHQTSRAPLILGIIAPLRIAVRILSVNDSKMSSIVLVT